MPLKIEKKYLGRWIAVKNSKVIDSDKKLIKLTNKVATRKDHNTIRYALIPNGLMAG